MDLGMGVLKILFSIFKVLFKPCVKIGHALGLEWMLVLYWIPLLLGGKGLFTLAVICTLLQIALNIYCKIKKEKSKNLVVYGFSVLSKRLKGENEKGFLADLNTDNEQSQIELAALIKALSLED